MSAIILGLLAAALAAGTLTLANVGSRKLVIFASTINFLLGFYVGYVYMPTISFWFTDLWWCLLVLLLVPTGLSWLIRKRNDANDVPAAGANMVTIFVLVATGFGLLYAATTSLLVRSTDYAALIGPLEERNLDTDLAPVDVNNIQQVPEVTASKSVNRIMGDDAGLGSRTDVGEKSSFILNSCFTARLLKGEIKELCFDKERVTAAPLEHSGFWTWFNNETTPAYTLASKVNPDKFYIITGIVKKEPGEGAPHGNPNKMDGYESAKAGEIIPIELRYLTSSYFGTNLIRHVYQNGYMSTGLATPNFEIDDEGMPQSVITTYENKVGFDGADATGVVIVDPISGHRKEYTLDNIPTWLDRVQPTSFIVNQLQWWGEYRDGWLNANFSKQDVQTTTDGEDLVEGADGKLYLYTGMTSTGNDMGTTGFMMVDTRTKRVRKYNYAGANETAAAQSATNAPNVRNNHFRAQYPVMYQIDNLATYFTPLLDDGNLVRSFAFINVRQHDIVGTGTTWQDAERDYRRKLASHTRVQVGDIGEQLTLKATVLDITSEVTGGTLMYYIMLQGQDGKEFVAPVDLSRQLKWTRPNDTVEITAESGETTMVPLMSFKNTSKPLLQ